MGVYINSLDVPLYNRVGLLAEADYTLASDQIPSHI